MVDGGEGDFCWGYYSMDHAIEDAKSIIDCETAAA